MIEHGNLLVDWLGFGPTPKEKRRDRVMRRSSSRTAFEAAAKRLDNGP